MINTGKQMSAINRSTENLKDIQNLNLIMKLKNSFGPQTKAAQDQYYTGWSGVRWLAVNASLINQAVDQYS